MTTTSDQPEKRVGRRYAGHSEYWDSFGQPTEACFRLIETVAGLGLSKAEIAALTGVSYNTFHTREKENEDIRESMAFGEAAAGLKVANALLRRAEKGDMAAIRWYEMTRKGRSERTESKSDSTVTQYVVEVPATQSEEAWEKAHSPAGLPSDDGTDSPL